MRAFIGLLTVIFALSFVSVAVAGDKANKRKGKHIYRKVYKECHGEDAIPVSPDSKTQSQWERVFKKKKFEVFGCEEKWEAMSEEDKRDVLSYLHGHAFDSPSPAKCK